MWQWWWVPSYIPFFNVTSTILPLRGAGLALSSRVDGPSWLHSRTPGSRGDAMWLLELGHQRVQLPNARWDTHPWSHQPPYKEFTDLRPLARILGQHGEATCSPAQTPAVLAGGPARLQRENVSLHSPCIFPDSALTLRNRDTAAQTSITQSALSHKVTVCNNTATDN